ncbi:MAG: hypothetical protein AB7P07_06335 [Hyphomonadaceae bacterium]
MYQSLDPAHIIATIERVKSGIDERFPGSGLGNVCAETIDTARHTIVRAAQLTAPNWPLRICVGAIIVLGVAAQVAAARFMHIERIESGPSLLESLEAAVNLLILFGGAVWFLISIEERINRQRVLAELHKLRSLAHVIDMHQLSKDPTILMNEHKGRNMRRFDLTRYLDHCAELLSLLGKLAALYADRMRDAVVIEAVTEIENLTSDLSRKIWQKIAILSTLEEQPPPPASDQSSALS